MSVLFFILILARFLRKKMYEKRSVFTDSERCILHFSEFIIDIIFVNVSSIAFQKMLLSKTELFCICFFFP